MTEFGFTQKNKTDMIGSRPGRVVGGFREHVGKVNPFSEHVAIGRDFGRRDSQALRQDSAKVGASGSVPE